ncbi:MAG: hypothetical protein GX030_10365 [Firmicutes bacterium]|nr:hypothetical protein [Bacillota bacterium]
MKGVLISGLSCTGKSTVIAALSARGYRALALDCDEWSTWTDNIITPADLGEPVKPGKDWLWREDRV